MYARDLFDANSVQWATDWRVTLVRVTPAAPVQLRFFPRIIQSLRFHFIGRAIPCSGEDCPACFAGVGSRPAHYLFSCDRRDPRHFGMIELGDSSMARLQELARDVPGVTNWLAGKFSRSAKNKPVLIDGISVADDQSGSMTPIQTMGLLARFYELPAPTSDHVETWHNQIRHTLVERLSRAVRSL